MDALESIVFKIIRCCILLIELAGTIVIAASMLRGLVDFLRRDARARLHLAQGIMLGLEFKLGSEVLRSVVVSSWSELGMLARDSASHSPHAAVALGSAGGRKAAKSRKNVSFTRSAGH